MKVIRDEQWNGLGMIPLLQANGIKRCNVSGCANKPTTVITEAVDADGDRVDFALCEEHYQECKAGEIKLHLEFDGSN